MMIVDLRPLQIFENDFNKHKISRGLVVPCGTLQLGAEAHMPPRARVGKAPQSRCPQSSTRLIDVAFITS